MWGVCRALRNGVDSNRVGDVARVCVCVCVGGGGGGHTGSYHNRRQGDGGSRPV